MAALMALIASPAASAQVSCPLNGYAQDVFLPGGGAWVVQSYNSLTLLEAPNAPIAMGVYCEGSFAFPPRTIFGASYAWNTGKSAQRIEVSAPGPGQSDFYSVAIRAPTGPHT